MSLKFLFQDFRNVIILQNTVITQGVVGQVADVSILFVPKLHECNNTHKTVITQGVVRQVVKVSLVLVP